MANTSESIWSYSIDYTSYSTKFHFSRKQKSEEKPVEQIIYEIFKTCVNPPETNAQYYSFHPETGIAESRYFCFLSLFRSKLDPVLEKEFNVSSFSILCPLFGPNNRIYYTEDTADTKKGVFSTLVNRLHLLNDSDVNEISLIIQKEMKKSDVFKIISCARLLSQGVRDEASSISSFPPELLAKIAACSANGDSLLTEDESLKIAADNFAKPGKEPLF